MNDLTTELREKIRQQFDSAPYPRTPVESSPKDDTNALYKHNFLTPFYLRNQQLTDTAGKQILDVGCGSGYKSLVLALANPGATIVGIDISEKSVALARDRLRFHGVTQAEFRVLSLDDVGQLDMEFDYINCDEMLYLMPDIGQTLQTLKGVLKPNGILRANLHSFYQRQDFFRAQRLFTYMGLMDGNPEETEIAVVLETMQALKDFMPLKQATWKPEVLSDHAQEYVLMNYLFQGDRGYTIPELFAALRGADLEFVNMVNWRSWDIMEVFADPDNLPMFWGMSLPDLTIEQRLHVFELIAPIHRLIDFWCGHPEQAVPSTQPSTWDLEEWQTVRVHLHPQLQTAPAKADLMETIAQQQSFELSRHLSAPVMGQVVLSPSMSACLLALWEAPQRFPDLVQRSLAVRPCDPLSLEPITVEQAAQDVRDALLVLELCLYVLFERSR